MPAVIVNYQSPTLWVPANANGKAVSVRGTRDGQPILLNFYWSGVGLATRPEDSDDRTLLREVEGFLRAFIPKDERELILHFQSTDDGFTKILDPKWVPGEKA